MVKKRKSLKLTAQEKDLLLSLIAESENDLDETDELSDCGSGKRHGETADGEDATTFIKAKIKISPLFLRNDRLDELATLGLQEGATKDRMTLAHTKQMISLIHNHVSFSTEAGCRILINVILLHVVSNMSGGGLNVNIIPDFRTPVPRYDHANASAVDILIVKNPAAYTNFLLAEPTIAFSNPEMIRNMSCIIYEAKKDGVAAAVPQAAIAAASFCRQHSLSTFRGCVTSGESWVFFVYNEEERGEGTVSIMHEIGIDSDVRLAQVLGLLYDWITHSKEPNQVFCTYLDL